MVMKLIKKTPEELVFVTEIEVGLANAIRRSVGEINVLAIDEVDVYKNDSALYDEIIAHRLGLLPLKNQKLKESESIEFKLDIKSKEGNRKDVVAGNLGEEVVYPEIPIVLLENGQELKLVARARVGKGNKHAKYSPGLAYYSHLAKISISKEGQKQAELAELYSDIFEIDSSENLKAKDFAYGDIDLEDLKNFPGVSVEFDNKLIFSVESWGQMEAKDIFTEACRALKSDVSQVLKAIK